MQHSTRSHHTHTSICSCVFPYPPHVARHSLLQAPDLITTLQRATRLRAADHGSPRYQQRHPRVDHVHCERHRYVVSTPNQDLTPTTRLPLGQPRDLSASPALGPLLTSVPFDSLCCRRSRNMRRPVGLQISWNEGLSDTRQQRLPSLIAQLEFWCHGTRSRPSAAPLLYVYLLR